MANITARQIATPFTNPAVAILAGNTEVARAHHWPTSSLAKAHWKVAHSGYHFEVRTLGEALRRIEARA